MLLQMLSLNHSDSSFHGLIPHRCKSKPAFITFVMFIMAIYHENMQKFLQSTTIPSHTVCIFPPPVAGGPNGAASTVAEITTQMFFNCCWNYNTKLFQLLLKLQHKIVSRLGWNFCTLILKTQNSFKAALLLLLLLLLF